MTAHTRSSTLLAFLAATALLAAAAPAHAIYMVTPLSLHGPEHGDVGDDLDFTVGPSPDFENATRDWAGKTVQVRYSYDRNENTSGSPDAPSDDSGQTERDLFDLVLDANASAPFSWKVPDEVKDHNVVVFIDSADGERLAFLFLAIGDAPPQMHILAASGEGPIEDSTTDPPLDGTNGDGTTSAGDKPAGEAPALGVILLIAVLSAAALGLTMLARRQ